MSKIAIYLKSLELNNIRTFGKVTLDLEKEDGTLPQWTLILGDNGIGKSTLLQCAAWMKPNLPVRLPGKKINTKDIHPNITDEENEVLGRLVQKSKNAGNIKATFIAQKPLNKNNNPEEISCETSISIRVQNGRLKSLEPGFFINNGEVFYEKEAVIYAYSASRKIGKLNIKDVDLEDTIPSFISENTILYDAEEILHTINYATLGSKRNEQKKYNNYLQKIKEALVAILPDFDAVDAIIVSPPKLINGRLQETELMITTKHGESIPFNNFSLGYKTVVSWVVDLSWRLVNQYPESINPLAEPAIVIIDEIDLHLHPLWQREVIENLSNHFPKVQFIATAHSPLMVQAALDANYAVLHNSDDGVIIIDEPEDVEDWRVDQILTSSFFGLPTSRGAKYEALMDERKQIISKKKLTPQDEEKLERITKQLSAFPSGETPEEIENRKVVFDIVEKIKNKKIKIEI